MPLEKVEFAAGRKQELSDYLREQLTQTISDRQELDAKWENSLIQSRAQKPQGELDFPFVGASNEEFPLTDIHFQPVYADFYQTLHAPEDYFSVTARRPDMVPFANAIREGLTAVEKKYIKMRRVNARALLDLITLGSAVYKNHWFERRFDTKDYDEFGIVRDKVKRISQPQVEHIPLQKFYFPAASFSLDPEAPGGTPWQAQRMDMTPSKFREWAKGSEHYVGFNKKDIEEVANWLSDEERPLDDEIREEDKYKPFADPKIRLFEVWCRWDTDDDGFDEDIVVVFHVETGKVLRAIFNPLMHGKWPFKMTKYLPWFGVYGRGLAEVDEWAQDSLTKLLNAQLDNVLLSNTRMYSAPLGSNIQPGEPIYPSKIWFVGPNEKVESIEMGDIYASLPNVISQIMQFSEMRTGVSEIRQGDISGLPSRTPATTMLALLQEGNKRFDMILSGFRDVHSEIGMEVLQNLVQYTKDDPLRWETFFLQSLGQEDGMLMMQALNSSMASLEESFGVGVSATSAQTNKEVEKQSFMGLLQVVGQIYAQLTQTAMLMVQVPHPLVQQTAASSYVAGVELLKRLLERFDIQNTAEYIPNLMVLQQMGALGAGSMGAAMMGQQPGMGMPGAGGMMGPQQLGILGGAGGIPPQLLAQLQGSGIAGF